MRAGRPKNRRQHFEQRLEQLIAFREKNNRWPEAQGIDVEERSIGTWCKKLKELYKLGRLEIYCVEGLQQIGYPMDFIQANWQRKLDLLKSYIEEHQKLPGARENLYSFCYHQLRFTSNLEDEKTRQLKAIGFFDLWEQRKEEHKNRWEASFKKLERFISVNGELPSGKKESGLQGWLRIQKQLFRKGRLSIDRAKQLQFAGIDLRTQPAETVSWEKRLDELKVYYLKNGALPFYKMDRKLYSWLSHQRNLHEEGKLSSEKIIKLNSVAINWSQKKRKRMSFSLA